MSPKNGECSVIFLVEYIKTDILKYHHYLQSKGSYNKLDIEIKYSVFAIHVSFLAKNSVFHKIQRQNGTPLGFFFNQTHTRISSKIRCGPYADSNLFGSLGSMTRKQRYLSPKLWR